MSLFRRDNSGQLLLVTALAIALLISSSTAYIYESTSNTQVHIEPPLNGQILAIKQAIRNTAVSTLVNVSNGGPTKLFSENMNLLSTLLGKISRFQTLRLAYEVSNNSHYDSGIRLSWIDNGSGISSASSHIILAIQSSQTNATLDYLLNVTSLVVIEGSCLVETLNQHVNITCRVFNENIPATARNISVSYYNLGAWIPVNSSNNLFTADHGDGSYLIKFVLREPQSNLQVRVQVIDSRGILVQANTTCTLN